MDRSAMNFDVRATLDDGSCVAFLRNGTVALRSVHGTFLSAQSDGSAEWDRTVADYWEQFHLEILQDDTITLLGVHGM